MLGIVILSVLTTGATSWEFVTYQGDDVAVVRLTSEEQRIQVGEEWECIIGRVTSKALSDHSDIVEARAIQCRKSVEVAPEFYVVCTSPLTPGIRDENARIGLLDGNNHILVRLSCIRK